MTENIVGIENSLNHLHTCRRLPLQNHPSWVANNLTQLHQHGSPKLYQIQKFQKHVGFASVIETHFLPYSLAIFDGRDDTNVLSQAPPPVEVQVEPELHQLMEHKPEMSEASLTGWDSFRP